MPRHPGPVPNMPRDKISRTDNPSLPYAILHVLPLNLIMSSDDVATLEQNSLRFQFDDSQAALKNAKKRIYELAKKKIKVAIWDHQEPSGQKCKLAVTKDGEMWAEAGDVAMKILRVISGPTDVDRPTIIRKR